jgi:transposase InsO family protein
LAQEVERYRVIYNLVRPHEALGFGTPAAAHLAEPNLFSPETVQET